jgi:hypothetical protein
MASDAPPELRRAEVEVHRQCVAEREPAWSAVARRGAVILAESDSNARKLCRSRRNDRQWQSTM